MLHVRLCHAGWAPTLLLMMQLRVLPAWSAAEQMLAMVHSGSVQDHTRLIPDRVWSWNTLRRMIATCSAAVGVME